jgi:hypothetical protein
MHACYCKICEKRRSREKNKKVYEKGFSLLHILNNLFEERTVKSRPKKVVRKHIKKRKTKEFSLFHIILPRLFAEIPETNIKDSDDDFLLKKIKTFIMSDGCTCGDKYDCYMCKEFRDVQCDFARLEAEGVSFLNYSKSFKKYVKIPEPEPSRMIKGRPLEWLIPNKPRCQNCGREAINEFDCLHCSVVQDHLYHVF